MEKKYWDLETSKKSFFFQFRTIIFVTLFLDPKTRIPEALLYVLKSFSERKKLLGTAALSPNGQNNYLETLFLGSDGAS